MTAVFTGAAAGVGRGIAEVLAAEGARVAIADINEAGAAAVAGALNEQGLQALEVGVDVTDRSSTDAMAASVIERLGGIDILAANAGIYPMVRLMDMDDTEWDRVMGIN